VPVPQRSASADGRRVWSGPQQTVQNEDIFLGDAIVSTDIVQFVFGRQLTDQAIRKHSSRQPRTTELENFELLWATYKAGEAV